MPQASGRRIGQLVASMLNVMIAAVVTVLINLWTSGWSIPVSVGLVLAVAGQGLILFWSTPRDTEPAKIDVDLALGKVADADADVAGARVQPDDRRAASIKMTATEVRGRLTGYDASAAVAPTVGPATPGDPPAM